MMQELEEAAKRALLLNHILLLSNVLLMLEKSSDLEEAKENIKNLLRYYASEQAEN